MAVLRDGESREVKDEEEILQRVYNYYRELYAQPAVAPTEKQKLEEVLTLLDNQVSEADNLQLLEPPNADELGEAVKKLLSDKAPGEDGLPAEVLRELWGEVGPYCLKFIQNVWQTKNLGKRNTGAIIKLLPKNDRKEDL
ncbi:hypothetical protein R1flu_012111 [Riccia fluitans]|uniref:Uncharacterized protein n=1 Tax=Riccia fluitans TaxID=41844 RepID=A0ABD1ZC50_9MARC